ncbi:MAG: GNAT family N-acetyltransferase [Acidimicrobiales bacterium]
MSTDSREDVVVTDDTDRHRYVATIDGQQAGFIVYYPTKTARLVVHTEVDDHYEGKGVASALVGGALDQIREAGGTVVPLCPYVRRWIERHDGFDSLIDEDLDTALRP